MPPTNSDQAFRDRLNKLRPGAAFIVMIFGALIAFEIFNYSTTDHALGDLLGSLTFMGLPWSTVLAIAFCGIDFAGIARLFTPEQGLNEPKEVWYLFGAWLLAATMNAILTWWGVSLAVAGHPIASSSVVDAKTITGVVPVFVAVMVWVIRILIIGTLSTALDRMLHPNATQHRAPVQSLIPANGRQSSANPGAGIPPRPMNIPAGLSSSGYSARPAVSRSTAPQSFASRPAAIDVDEASLDAQRNGRPEPTYHSLNPVQRPMPGTSAGANGAPADRFRRT